MRDYADRGYVLGRVHGLLPGFLRRGEYVALMDRMNSPGSGGLDMGFNLVFREQIGPLLELIEASPYFRELLVSVLRFAECLNALRIRHPFGEGDPGPWFDISPYNILNNPAATGPDSGAEPPVVSSFLDSFLTGDPEKAAAGDFDGLVFSYMDNLDVVAKGFPGVDRVPLLACIDVIRKHLEFEALCRSRRFYRVNGAMVGEKSCPAGEDGGMAAWGRGADFRTDEGIMPMPDFATLGRQITLIFRRHWNTASVLAMYLFSLFVQIRNCVMLAEGRRLGMERDELLQLLVCGE